MATNSALDSTVKARLANVRYAEKEYWNNRYKSQPCEFDWFYGYTALRKVVRTFVKRSKPVLHVGCGNSNFQEGMARDGYQVVNTDISEVVVEQMRAKHRDLPRLTYLVSDCRSMPEFLDFQFGSVIDKGTVDALLCSRNAAEDIRNMFSSISRVLIPGGVFLLVTLGGPSQRLALMNQPQFGWSVQVCLVRRVADDQFAPSEPGRAIPLNDTAKPLSYIGPLEVLPDGTVVGLPEPFEPSSFFYAYVCRKAPLVLATGGEGDPAGRVRLPEAWKAAVRAVAKAVQGEVGLPKDILSRGRRIRTITRASFEREQRERELERQRLALSQAAGRSQSCANMDLKATAGGAWTATPDLSVAGSGSGDSCDGGVPSACGFGSGPGWFGSKPITLAERAAAVPVCGGGGAGDPRPAGQRSEGGTCGDLGGGQAAKDDGSSTVAAAPAADGVPQHTQQQQPGDTGAPEGHTPTGGSPGNCGAGSARWMAPAAATAGPGGLGSYGQCLQNQSGPRFGSARVESAAAAAANPLSAATTEAGTRAHISYRRLSLTVQNAFAKLDGVDGDGCCAPVAKEELGEGSQGGEGTEGGAEAFQEGRGGEGSKSVEPLATEAAMANTCALTP